MDSMNHTNSYSERNGVRVCAGIVLFNPDIEQLKRNVCALQSQVNEFVFVDNASENVAQIKEMLGTLVVQHTFVGNSENRGVAAALNQICEYAKTQGYIWALTMDQDSICSPDMVVNLTQYIGEPCVGVISPMVVADKIVDMYVAHGSFEDIEQCITSGSLISVPVWSAVDGFDEVLFIDRVDFEYCKRVKLAGYRVLRINGARLTQNFGTETKVVKFFGKKLYSFEYSPLRNYYFVRNGIYCIRKFGKDADEAAIVRGIFAWEYAILRCEKNKLAKLSAAVRGALDGARMEVKPWTRTGKTSRV